MGRLFRLAVVLGWIAAADLAAQDTLSLYRARDSLGRRDPNGFLLNPSWHGASVPRPDIESVCRFRAATGHLEERTLVVTRGPCLSAIERQLVTLNEAPTILGLGLVCKTNDRIGTVRGHVNWFPVTATGLLYNLNHSRGPGKDQDVTMDLAVSTPNALTKANAVAQDLDAAAYHIEFYAKESVARLPPGASWWHSLRAALFDSDLRGSVTDGRLAVVTGLFGLDGVHDFHSELHPVFGMAVLLDTTRVGGRLQEQWALMVQNLANEGDCATGRFPMVIGEEPELEQQYVFDLGWWNGARDVRVELGPSWSSDTTHRPRTARVPGRHLYVGFEHPRPRPGDDDFLFLGTVMIEWSSEGDGPWVDRFAGWYPETAQGITVGQYPERDIDSDQAVEIRGNVLKRLPGREAIAANLEDDTEFIDPLPGGALETMDGEWSPAPGVLAQPVIPWSYSRVRTICGPNQNRRDPLCRGGWRFAIGPTYTVHDELPLLFGSILLYSHGERRLGEVFGAFTWRLDVRPDRYQVRAVDEVLTVRKGLGIRVGPVLSSTNFRFLPKGVLTPYLSGGIGPFIPTEGDKAVRLSLAAGAGLQVEVGFSEFFVEYQVGSTVRGGDRRHTVSFGMVLAKPFW